MKNYCLLFPAFLALMSGCAIRPMTKEEVAKFPIPPGYYGGTGDLIFLGRPPG